MTATVTPINGDTDVEPEVEYEIIDADAVDYQMSPDVYRPTELHVDPAKLEWAEWQAHGHRLRRVESGHQWWWGDWLRLGEDRFGEAVYGVIDIFAAEKTLQQWVRIAVLFSPTDRRPELTFSHHKEAAGLPTLPARRKALKLAVENAWSTRELADYVRQNKPADEGAPAGEPEAATSHTWRRSFRLDAIFESIGDEIDSELEEFLDELIDRHDVREHIKVEAAKS